MFFLKQKNFIVPVMQHIGCNAVPLLSLQHVSYAYTWRSLTPCFTSVISGTQLWIWNLAQILTLCSVKCLFKVNSKSYYTVYCLHYLTIFCSVEFCPICQALLFLNPACPSCRSLSIHVAAYIIYAWQENTMDREDPSLLCWVNFGDPFILCFDDKDISPVNRGVSLIQRALMGSVRIFVNLLMSAFNISVGMDSG